MLVCVESSQVYLQLLSNKPHKSSSTPSDTDGHTACRSECCSSSGIRQPSVWTQATLTRLHPSRYAKSVGTCYCRPCASAQGFATYLHTIVSPALDSFHMYGRLHSVLRPTCCHAMPNTRHACQDHGSQQAFRAEHAKQSMPC